MLRNSIHPFCDLSSKSLLKTIRRFWASVDQDGAESCWLWKGPIVKPSGGVYGIFNWGVRMVQATHVSAFLHGLWRKDTSRIQQKCGNNLCVNPKHFSIRAPATISDLFWEQVKKGANDECWLWMGSSTDKSGYGRFTIKRRMTPAHRVALIFSGIKIPKEAYVLHHCDNRLCCNPSHLYVGTAKDNARDMVVRRRGLIGSLNGKAKLTEEDVVAIRKYRKENPRISMTKVAEEWGVSFGCIYQLITRRRWKHVP